ncbi:MAG TPA: cardiolipin synthase [Clostridia bacterium]|nr:cardiolipin synthase [Clostridia bacterium]
MNFEWWTVLYIGFVLFFSVIILLERRSPPKTVAWLFVLAFLPYLGFLFYMLFGRNWRKKRWVRAKQPIEYSQVENAINHYTDRLMADRTAHYALGSKDRLMYMLIQSASAPLTTNNKVTVLKDASEKYPVLFDMIKKAEGYIHLEYYIIRDDKTGRHLVDLLLEKAAQGVEIRVLYDAVGSSAFARKHKDSLQRAGIKLSSFLPVRIPVLNSGLNYRNHRKIAVVDGRKALVGGINIGDEYLGLKELGYWRDTHLLLEGDAVNAVHIIFLLDWFFASEEEINLVDYLPKQEPKPEGHYVQVAASGPDTEWESIHQMYFSIITSAENSLYITSPYFVPGDSILMALKTAALSGVDVRLIIPSKPDHKIVHWASHSYLEEVMEAGVRVYLYQKGFIHAKVLIADGSIASVGTANMDERSFNHNFEVNALIYSREVVEDIEEQFFQDIRDSRELFLEVYRRKTLFRRLKESLARLLSPLL